MSPLSAFKAVILHLLLLTIAHQRHHMFVKGDDRLIQVECHNADVPEVCIQCLKSDPRSENANSVGIAEIVVGCLRSHANILMVNMKTLASATKDEGYKVALQQCGHALTFADGNLIGATSGLKNGSYDGAEHSVTQALTYEIECDSAFGRYERYLPAKVSYERRIYEELSEAAKRIIERL